MGYLSMVGDSHFHRGYSLRLQKSKPLISYGIISFLWAWRRNCLQSAGRPGAGALSLAPAPDCDGVHQHLDDSAGLDGRDVVGADDSRGPACVDPADLCPCDALWHLQTGYAGATSLGSGLRPETVYGGVHEAVRATLPLVTASFSLGL